jgi:hypothetical protein
MDLLFFDRTFPSTGRSFSVDDVRIDGVEQSLGLRLKRYVLSPEFHFSVRKGYSASTSSSGSMRIP